MAALLRLAALAVLCAAAGARAQFAEERAPRYIASAASQNKPAPPPPVAILKQINRHNEDGSYTYGFESADGSFKIETKSPTGEVKGKYGYKDDTGKLRVIEYGADKYGFQPAGEGITVAPPTLVDESAHEEDSRPSKSQGGRTQYRAPVQAAPTPDYDYEEPAPAPPRPAPRPAPQQHFRQQQYRPAPQAAPAPPKPAFFPGAAPAPAPLEEQSFFRPAAAPRKQDFRPAPQLQNQNFAPAPAPRPQVEYSQQYEQPAEPRFPQAPQPRFAPAQQPQPQYQHSFSMLDQLLKEYALPQGGSSPTHDITFGSY